MRLTEHEINRFRTFGYLVFPGHFAAEIGDITDAFEKVWADHGADTTAGSTTTSTDRRWCRS